MKQLAGQLISHLRDLPHNLRTDLRPGVCADDSASRRLRRNFVYHLHPLRVSERALRFSTTLGLGLITLFLLGVLLLSGVLLMLYYVPTAEGAYASMLDIDHAVTFGALVRRVHRFAGHAMVVSAGLHLVRIIAMAAYRHRELNWLVGIGLLLVVLGMAFTGYLLPWDQTSYWAVRVVASMLDHLPVLGPLLQSLILGGSQIGAATLVRFYALHVAVLPALALVLATLHLWRIRRDGGLACSPDSQAASVSAWPHLVLREGILLLVLVGTLVVWAMLVDAPLGPPADTLRPENPEKAPWYFLGIQEMVSYSAVTGGVLFPGVLLLVLLALPYFDRGEDSIGVWLGSERSPVAAALIATVLVTPASVAVYLRYGHAAGGLLADILNPAAVSLVLASCAFALAGQRCGDTRAALRAALAVMLCSLLLFTVVGMCRGPDWLFYWPWEAWSRGA